MTALDPDWHDGLLASARVLLSLMFFASARDKLAVDPREVAMIRTLGLPAPKLLERTTGVFEGVTAALLVVGIGARTAAGLLAAFTIFTTIAFLRFWSLPRLDATRPLVRSLFYANWAVTAGLIVVTAVGPGRLALSAW